LRASASFMQRITNTQIFRTMEIATSGTPIMPRESSNLVGSFPRRALPWRSCFCAGPFSSLGCSGSSVA
jgi:hypothetical protein